MSEAAPLSWGKALQETRADLAQHRALPTGFPGLDLALSRGGLRPQHVTLLIARMGVGKTAFAGQVAVNACTQGAPVLFVSAEMTTPEVTVRALSSVLNVSTDEVETQLRGETLDSRLLQGNEVLRNLYILDKARPTWDDIRHAVDCAPQRPQLLVIDHLQLVAKGAYTKSQDKVSASSEQAKVLAKSEDVSVLLLHQVARQSVDNVGTTDKRLLSKNHGDVPLSAEDGYMGGEADADVVLGLYRPDKAPGEDPAHYAQWQGRMVLQLLKNRHGPGDTSGWVLSWRPSESMRISEEQGLRDFLDTVEIVDVLGKG